MNFVQLHLKCASYRQAYQVVWCKYGKHAEWPSILLDKSVWAHRWSKLKKLSNQKVLVFWLGDGSVANVLYLFFFLL